jgi:hypothetical protein
MGDKMLHHPTGGLMLRKDKAGSGEFKSPRGSRLHAGQDYRCTPGQWVFAPISGILTRGLYVYPQDFLWKGLEIANEVMTGLVCKLFYVEILDHKIGTMVVAEVKKSHLLEKGKRTYINPNCFGVGLPGA